MILDEVTKSKGKIFFFLANWRQRLWDGDEIHLQNILSKKQNKSMKGGLSRITQNSKYAKIFNLKYSKW